jgi:hypothetical protein
MHEHKIYCLTHMLKSLLDYTVETNGQVDHTQLLIWKVDGQEIGCSLGGKHTMTPLFKQLVIDQLNKIYE